MTKVRRRAVARRTDPETSHEAADSVGDLRKTQKVILELIRRCGPCTDVDLVEAAHEFDVLMSESGIRTRRKELVEAGLVRWTGRYDTLPSGRRGRVWEAVRVHEVRRR